MWRIGAALVLAHCVGCAATPQQLREDAGTDGTVAPDLSADIAPDGSADATTDVLDVATFPAPIPVGMDGFSITNWPTLRVGVRGYMRSTYDRAGNNETADANHHLRQEGNLLIPLDIRGLGEIRFVRHNHWHGSPWHYQVDGRDAIVQETTSKDPDFPIEGSTFLPESAFPRPLALTWSETRGADLSWVPIGFSREFKLGYERAFYSTGYFIYHLFDRDAPTTRPISSWDVADKPSTDVVALLGKTAADLLPSEPTVNTASGTFSLPTKSKTTIFESTKAGQLLAFSIKAPSKDALQLGRGWIHITFDGEARPQVSAPIALFFGAGTLFRRDSRVDLVHALPVTIRYPVDRPDVELTSIFPMPFDRSVKIEIDTLETPIVVRTEVRTTHLSTIQNHLGLFHATYRNQESLVEGQDMVFLNTRDHGSGFCGHFVGTSWIFSRNAYLPTLEGDPRFFFDDARSPQAYGTGTEEWGGGGDYWGGQTMTMALVGHPVGAPSKATSLGPEDNIESAYRFLLPDVLPFGKNARIQFEHGGTNESTEATESVSYWYARKGACLREVDRLAMGDADSESLHALALDRTWSAANPITSRYELGPDVIKGRTIFEAESRVERHGTGPMEATFAIPKDNLGVMLRRTLDYSFVDQEAEVLIAPTGSTTFESAGFWYLAGSNRSLFVLADGEKSPPKRYPQESNRRFREDEFLIPRHLTQGRESIRIRLVPRLAPKALFDGSALPISAFSVMDLTVWSWRPPS